MNRRNLLSQRNSFISLGLLIVLIFTLSLYYSSVFDRKDIFKDYCGNFGFYGKSLTLFKSEKFIYTYHGCSDTRGRFEGTWKIEKGILELFSKDSEGFESKFIIRNDTLKSIETREMEFVECENFISEIEKISSKEE